MGERTNAARIIEEAGAALAAALVREGQSRPVQVRGLGIFHVRHRGERAGGAGVLFVLAPELRAAITDAKGKSAAKNAKTKPKPPRAEPDVFVFGDGDPGVEALATWVRDTVASGADAAVPELGVFSPLITTPKIFSDLAAKTSKIAPPRPTVSFAPSQPLRKRLGSGTDPE